MVKQSRERSDIYDTQAFIRLNIDLRQALFLSVLAVATYFGCRALFGQHAAILALAPVIYFCSLACSDRVRLLPPLVLLASTYLLVPDPELFRLSVFAAVIAYVPWRRQTLSALYVLGALWAATIAVLWHFNLPLDAARLPFRILVEAVSFLFLYFLLWTGRFSVLFHRLPPLVHSGAVVTALCLLVSCSAALLLLNAFLATASLSFSALAVRVVAQPQPWVVAFFGFLGTAIFTALSLNALLRSHAVRVRELAEAIRPFKPDVHHAPRILEFEEALKVSSSAFERLRNESREAQLASKNVQHTLDAHHREMAEREARARNLEVAMAHAPVGCLTITAAGGIVAVNERFFEITEIAKADVLGKHYSLLEGGHTWRQEVFTALAWAAREHRTLLGKPPFKCFTSTVGGDYLELSLDVRLVSELSFEKTRVDPRLPVSDALILLFVRRAVDLRDFQLRLLNPSPREVLGTQALEICEDLQLKLSSFREHVANSSGAIRRSRAAAEAQLLLTELERFIEEAALPLRELSDKSSAAKKNYVEVDLGRLLQASFSYLYELLALDDEIVIYAGQQPLAEQKDFRVLLTADPAELTQLLPYLLALVQSILPRASKLSINIGYEQIGSSTASLVPGSRPGQYVRLVISHPGQSVTTNMVPMSIRHLGPVSDEIGVTEVAIAFLTHQTQELGGFVSLQSSAQKGTFITVYVPEDPRRIEKPGRNARRERAVQLLAPRVLVLWDSAHRSEQLEKRLRSNRYEVLSRSWDELLAETEQPLSFGGVGFGETSGSDTEVKLVLPEQAVDELGKFTAVLVMPDVPREALRVLLNGARHVVPIVSVGVPEASDDAPHLSETASQDEVKDLITGFERARHVTDPSGSNAPPSPMAPEGEGG